MDQHRNTTATVRAVLAATKEKNVDPGQLLSKSGISLELAMDPDGEVTLSEMRAFWQNAYALSGDPYLAIHAGIKAVHGSYKTLDYLLFAATTLGEGIQSFVTHFRLINTWLNFAVEETSDQVHVTLRSEIGPVPPPAVEITFTAFAERSRQLLGATWAPASIAFLHETSGEASYYQGFFRCPISFGAERAVMSLSKEQWDTPLPGGNEGLFRVLESHAGLLKADRPKPDDIVARAQVEILKQLQDGVPTIENVAARLGLGLRTFQRRLSEQEVHFTQLVDALREGQARELVRAGSVSLSEIAFFLGFADQSAFSRAFKRWTGQSPRAYRSS